MIDIFSWIVLIKVAHLIRQVMLRQIAITNYINPF